MAVRAKFYVSEMTKRAYNPEHVTVVLQPVVRGDENKEWAAATPSGNITMQVNNASAGRQFDAWMNEKREVYIDFTPVEVEEG